MSRVKSRGTAPELAVKRIVHSLVFRYRNKDYALPGKPDIVLPKYKGAIYVHGCFWHQHKTCRGNRVPKSKVEYWKPKLERNVQRDKKCLREIKRLGWHPYVVWECQLKDKESLILGLQKFLSGLKG
jgi:DNA mismatch endonuclease (patch repair protein)